MSDEEEFLAELLAAMPAPTGPPMSTVRLETGEATELLFYGPGPEHHDGGSLTLPASTPKNRRWAAITRGCPLCPDVNQGLTHQEHDLGPEAGTYITAVYRTCGHGAVLRLDEDEPPFIFAVDA
ncbi:hypothetical protein [Streptomyces eurythermus]